jgi:hypothetical protein
MARKSGMMANGSTTKKIAEKVTRAKVMSSIGAGAYSTTVNRDFRCWRT